MCGNGKANVKSNKKVRESGLTRESCPPIRIINDGPLPNFIQSQGGEAASLGDGIVMEVDDEELLDYMDDVGLDEGDEIFKLENDLQNSIQGETEVIATTSHEGVDNQSGQVENVTTEITDEE